MRFILLTCFLAIGLSGGIAQDYSVGGLTLGMTSAQVKAKLGPKYQEQVGQKPVYPGEPVPSVLQQFTSQGFQGTTHDGFSLEYVDDKLIYIQHEISWPDGKNPPNTDETISDLFIKFGNITTNGVTPTSQHLSDTTDMLWAWDSTGHPKSTRTNCEIQSQGYFISALTRLSFPTGTRPGCGMAARAAVTRNIGNRALLVDLEVTVLDQAKFYDAVLKVVNRKKNEQNVEADKAKGRKAPL